MVNYNKPHPWFGSFALCLSLIQNLTLYPLKITSVSLPLPTSVKNKDKYVFLLHFYVSLLPIYIYIYKYNKRNKIKK